MTEIRNVKYRGSINITYEMLSELLGLNIGSIINIIVDPESEKISVIHNDKDLSNPTAENAVIESTHCRTYQCPVIIPEFTK